MQRCVPGTHVRASAAFGVRDGGVCKPEGNKKIIVDLDGVEALRGLVKLDDDRIRQQAYRALVNLGADE